MSEVARVSLRSGLTAAFWEYERALMANDLEALDRLFAAYATTLRGDAGGLLVGHDAISAFRGSRGGAPARRIVATHVQEIDDRHALVVAVTELATGGRGQQTQLWRHDGTAWAVTAAHVAGSAPALDRRVWRVVGDPLVPPTGTGPLGGETVAVKDLFAVAGQRIGAGNPTWLESAPVENENAAAVDALLGAGASLRGLARTDELAYSLAGTNPHYGTPPNPRAPHRISGGSTSGPASAVSLGHATIGLGTDTGGSIRVPAAYQGLWGIRPTHGAVSAAGLLPLAPSFDTVGWLTRGPDLLAGVGAVLLPEDTAVPGDLVTASGLWELATPDVRDAVEPRTAGAVDLDWPVSDLPTWLEAFRVVQAGEAWASHGAWLEGRLDGLGPDIRSRFEVAATVTPSALAAARAVVDEVRDQIRDRLAGRVLLLPSASSVAPSALATAGLDEVRRATMLLTCIAGIGGLPVVSVPVETGDRLPAGLSLVGPAGSDRALIDLAHALAD
ncbi:amidase [Aeromicrobium sp. Sec7.5]|uniref:amidase n=1 Tax=Aeromicrobium sp. Sec7.5 TaxID=3121276 RepID=UPI002FE4E657